MAMRAAGAGKKVYICQFLKGRFCCELASLKKLKNIKIEQFGTRRFIRKAPGAIDAKMAKEALEAARKAIKTKQCDIIIMDELNAALRLGLIKLKDVLELIGGAPKKIELVITGRDAPSEIIERADLVSEIREVKHYFRKGVRARRGIEF